MIPLLLGIGATGWGLAIVYALLYTRSKRISSMCEEAAKVSARTCYQLVEDINNAALALRSRVPTKPALRQ